MEWNKNKVTAIVSFMFSIFVIYLAFQIKTPPSATMDFLGPKGFPLIISTILIICSIGIFFLKVPTEESGEIGVQEIINLLPYLGVIFLFIVLAPFIGLVISIFLLMMTLIYFIEKGRLLRLSNIIISASIALGIWVIFSLLLRIQIPAWPVIF